MDSDAQGATSRAVKIIRRAEWGARPPQSVSRLQEPVTCRLQLRPSDVYSYSKLAFSNKNNIFFRLQMPSFITPLERNLKIWRVVKEPFAVFKITTWIRKSGATLDTREALTQYQITRKLRRSISHGYG